MLLYVSYFRFLLDSFNLEKCTLSLCSWILLSVYVWNHVLLFEYLKLAPCNFFGRGSKGESEVAAHVLTSSRQLFSGLQCLNLSQPSYWVPITLELLVLLKSSQMPGCFLLHDWGIFSLWFSTFLSNKFITLIGDNMKDWNCCYHDTYSPYFLLAPSPPPCNLLTTQSLHCYILVNHKPLFFP